MATQTEIFRRLVRDHMGPPPARGEPGSLIVDVVARMASTGTSSAVIVNAAGRPKGIVTEKDVVRLVAERVALDSPVKAVMSAPVVTVESGDYLFHAVAVMRRRKLRQIPVVDSRGCLVGMLDLNEALGFLAGSTMQLIEHLTHEQSLEGLQRVKQAQVGLADALLGDNMPVFELQSVIAEINADIHRRVLRSVAAAMVESGWGEPPVPYALIIMGSGGRGESFLAPDQDNGFILADHAEDERGHVDTYFTELAERMSRMLDAVGFPLCTGNVMATNPIWRKSLTEWRHQIDRWMRKREERMLLNCDIFFDFCHGFGDAALSRELRAHVTEAAPRNALFLRDIFLIASGHDVALGWFGRLRLERDAQQRKGMINLKLRGTLPLVEGARLLALQAGIPDTSTIARLDAIRQQGKINPQDHDCLVGAFQHIARLLLRQQIEDSKDGREVTNYVPETRLSPREKHHLVDCFRAIDNFRAALKSQFAGAAL